MTASSPTPAQLLSTPVQYLKGVGPERAELMQLLELNTVADVLFHFPRDYQDFTYERAIANLEEGRPQTVRGVIDDIDFRVSQSGKAVLGVLIRSQPASKPWLDAGGEVRSTVLVIGIGLPPKNAGNTKRFPTHKHWQSQWHTVLQWQTGMSALLV